MSDGQPKWQNHAACRGIDSDLFFPGRGESNHEAKAVCAVCPVREACLDAAIANREPLGIWGGLTETERDKLRWERAVARSKAAA